MTDSRVSRGLVQVLDQPVPNARLSRAVLQVLTSTVAPTTHYVRTAGSANPLQMKQPDGTWWPVEATA